MDWRARIREALSTGERTPDEDVVEELTEHARALYGERRAEGDSADEAGAAVAAQIDLWCRAAPHLKRRPRAAAVEPPPATASGRWTAGLAHDIRYGARLLRRQSGFTLLVVATMALGIAATTVLFSVTWGVLIKPLPWPGAARLVVLKETRGGVPPRFGAFTNAAYLAWREEAATVDALAAWSVGPMTLSGEGEPERIRVVSATAGLFSALGVRPLIGALFEEQHETLASGSPIVLSERLWRLRFDADPGVPGRAVQLDGRIYTVTGVLADAQAFPDREALAWVPFRVQPATGNFLSMFSALGRLRPGATAAQAAAEGTARGRFAADTGLTTTAIFGSSGPIEISATPLGDALAADVRRPLVVLFAAVLLLLATATANVAGLQLARATTRGREMAIRAAIGAGAARVTRQLLVESLLLATAGGAAGLLLALVSHRALPSLLPAGFPRADDLRVDGVVVLFALAVSMACGIAFGLLPALRVRRLNLVDSLAQGGAATVHGAQGGTARARLLIMTGQVAIACVLLVGASLLGRSFVAMLNAERGYDPSGVLTARLSLSGSGLTPERRFALVERILERLGTAPGVGVAAFTSELPLTPGGSTSAFSIPSPRGDGSTLRAQASPRIVSPQAFAALGMRIIAGRGFTADDVDTAEPVVVVNRAFARRYLGDTPLGVRLPASYDGPDGETIYARVAGIVDDVRYVTDGDSSQPEMYYSHRQADRRLVTPVVTLLLRAEGDPRALVPALRAAVREADDRLAPEAVLPLDERLLATLARPRLYAVVLGGFAGFALAIAGVGLFGVLSYSVAQRAREMAVRSALGASPSDIIRLVLRQGATVAIGGVAAGLLGSLWLTQLMSTFLYGIAPHDPVTFAAVPLLLLVVATAACLVPARRAARIDPLAVLRAS